MYGVGLLFILVCGLFIWHLICIPCILPLHPRLARLPASARQELPGITADRTFQIVAGAVVLHSAMTALKVDELEVSPWALREGVLLRYIESLSWTDPT